jgi:threonine synthase
MGWYDISTLREPCRLEGKKTMGFELAEQLEWTVPDCIIYPTGGGTGLIGMWKAFAELEEIGWIGSKRPRMVSVQPEGCAPIIRAFKGGADKADLWEDAHTVADGLRVPRAIGDFLILQVVRDSGGTAVAVSDADMVRDMMELGRLEGISASPEGAASLTALRHMIADGIVARDETIVLFNTGGALKYLDLLHPGDEHQSPNATPIARAVLSKS